MCPEIYPQIYHRTPCPAVLGLIKSKGGVGSFQVSQKERLFHFLCQPSALRGIVTMWPPSCTLQKRRSFGQEENIPKHLAEPTNFF